MGLGLRTNLISLDAQRYLKQSTGRLNQSFERLASGLRVNRSSDDAAGLGIAQGLRSDARVATVSIRNASTGISVISIADMALGQVGNILNRLLELAQQSATSTYSMEQRSAMGAEYSALASEIERIATVTEFDGNKLLAGGSSIAFQVGFDGSSLSWFSMSNVQATLADLGLATSGSAVPAYSLVAATEGESVEASRLAVNAISEAVDRLNRSRGSLGAVQSRLQSTIENLGIARESFQQSEAGIMDADVAEEASEMSKASIRQQAGTALLAQANLQPRLVLELLRD
ncbi:MAG: flagellin [Pseudomonadota bacterium]|jgi:flagellin